MEDDAIILTCPNCGSNSIDKVGDIFICNHCKTKFMKKGNESASNKSIKTINIINSQSTKNRVESYLIKNDLTEDDFLKKAFVFLTNYKEAPRNIFNAEFSNPKLEYEHVSVLSYNCKISYSLSIRVERRVKKKVEEEYYDQRSNSFKTHLVDKYVTETFYEPYFGEYSDIVSTNEIQNNKYSSFEKDCIIDILKSVYEDDLVMSNEEYQELSYKQTKSLQDRCVNYLKKHYKDYITIDNYKDLKFLSTYATLENTTTYKVPIYSLSFKLDEKSYTLYCVANNYRDLFVEDLVDEQKEKLINNYVEKKDKIFKPSYYMFTAFSIAFLIAILLSFFITIAQGTQTLNYTLFYIWYVIICVLFITEKCISSKNKKELNIKVKDYENNSRIKKKESCLNYCKKNNITNLDFNE